MAVLFYLSWLAEVVPTLVVLPVAALAAVWPWRGRPLGYALAGALLASCRCSRWPSRR